LRDARPHPGHNLGLGQQSCSTTRARLGRIAGPSIWRRWSRSDGCTASSGEQNPPPRPRSANPSGHLHSHSLSLRLIALPSLLSQSLSERQRREQAARPGAIAGPLAGVRAPQWVSAPPSSGLAVVTPWPSPASSEPGSVFFSRAGEKVFPTPGEVFPFPFPFLLSHPLLFDLDLVFLLSEPVMGY